MTVSISSRHVLEGLVQETLPSAVSTTLPAPPLNGSKRPVHHTVQGFGHRVSARLNTLPTHHLNGRKRPVHHTVQVSGFRVSGFGSVLQNDATHPSKRGTEHTNDPRNPRLPRLLAVIFFTLQIMPGVCVVLVHTVF